MRKSRVNNAPKKKEGKRAYRKIVVADRLNSRKGRNVRARTTDDPAEDGREGCARRDGGGCSVRGR